MFHTHARQLTSLLLLVLLGGCEMASDTALPTEAGLARSAAHSAVAPDAGPWMLAPPVFDVDVAPDGSVLVAGGSTIMEIRKGAIDEIAGIPALPLGTTVNGVAAVGRRSMFASTGGADQAMGAGVWHVSAGRVRLIGDIEAFETQQDPDALFGPQWKDPRCEEDPSQGFTAGPQSNPYHLALLSGTEALVADAAGNTLLAARKNGSVELVAVFTPPVDENDDWRVLFPLSVDTDCYVQPVPTSVAIGPDGAYYVGELTGAPAVPGWSRVWRIEPGARNVVCPSGDCRQVTSGLTSVIDLAFAPDGSLYVVEFDTNGWLEGAFLGNPGGGRILSCDVSSGACSIVADDLVLPGSIAFDGRGGLWLLENGVFAPVVRRIDLP